MRAYSAANAKKPTDPIKAQDNSTTEPDIDPNPTEPDIDLNSNQPNSLVLPSLNYNPNRNSFPMVRRPLVNQTVEPPRKRRKTTIPSKKNIHIILR